MEQKEAENSFITIPKAFLPGDCQGQDILAEKHCRWSKNRIAGEPRWSKNRIAGEPRWSNTTFQSLQLKSVTLTKTWMLL